MEKRLVNGGLLIAFEGIHGCGKSTQVSLLDQKLQNQGYQTITTKEVTGTPLADKISSIAFEEEGEPFRNPLIMSLLIAASRASRVSQIIKPSLEAENIVLCDRYAASMLVFQHFCDGVNLSFVRKLNDMVTDKIYPDATFILDVTVEEGLKRRVARLGPDEHLSGWDARIYEFHRRSREGYLHFSKKEPFWHVLNGMAQPQEIAGEIFSLVSGLIHRKNES